MRVLSGMRPTGKLHLGHLHGALRNWKLLQSDHECFFCIVDYHALTSEYSDSRAIPGHIQDMLLDWLASGIDPELSTLFVQSHIPQLAELYLLFGMITPLGWLERNPTYKEQRKEIKDRDLSNLGFLSYPVLQAADIALYKGEGVPVGQDQVPHLEIAREIVRRFNHLYGQCFPEPSAILTAASKINGLDGRKMSKSYNNAIFLSDDDQTIESKIKSMVTDVKRLRRNDPGDPDTCNLFPLHEVYSSQQTIAQVREGCTSAGIGCVDCKKMLTPSLLRDLAPIRERRFILQQNPKQITDILHHGKLSAQKAAHETMQDVKERMHLS